MTRKEMKQLAGMAQIIERDIREIRRMLSRPLNAAHSSPHAVASPNEQRAVLAAVLEPYHWIAAFTANVIAGKAWRVAPDVSHRRLRFLAAIGFVIL
jgi:hypothetical protein